MLKLYLIRHLYKVIMAYGFMGEENSCKDGADKWCPDSCSPFGPCVINFLSHSSSHASRITSTFVKGSGLVVVKDAARHNQIGELVQMSA